MMERGIFFTQTVHGIVGPTIIHRNCCMENEKASRDELGLDKILFPQNGPNL